MYGDGYLDTAEVPGGEWGEDWHLDMMDQPGHYYCEDDEQLYPEWMTRAADGSNPEHGIERRG